MKEFWLGIKFGNKNIPVNLKELTNNKVYLNRLDLIDDFTADFESEEDIKKYLCENGLITNNDLFGKLVIFKYLDGKNNGYISDIIYKNLVDSLNSENIINAIKISKNQNDLINHIVSKFNRYKITSSKIDFIINSFKNKESKQLLLKSDYVLPFLIRGSIEEDYENYRYFALNCTYITKDKNRNKELTKEV